MVRALHAAGIEVILDVVYNHTAEGNHLGPTLSMRGIDNEAYYRLEDDDQRYYTDYTGTGNSLNVGNPHALQLIMDSLRYWVTEMHVDGFRFDLASTLAREFYDVDRLATFFELVQQDPVVSQVKLIAEPWDVGPGGYQVGNFPPQWTEWNGKYRDTVRDFWRGEPQTLGEFASRLTGSADLYEHSGRRPVASINFVTAHDGFTLRDLVSYNEKHNEANGEDNNDGESHNRSEQPRRRGPDRRPRGPRRCAPASSATSSPRCCSRRACRCSLHGDELGRTQDGNNNGYAQDNEITWIDWEARRPAAHRVHRRRSRGCAGSTRRSVAAASSTVARCAARRASRSPTSCGCAPTAPRWQPEDWDSGFGRAVGVFLNGARHPRARPPRRADHRRALPRPASTRATSRSTSRCRTTSTARSGTSSSTPRASAPTRDPLEPGDAVGRARPSRCSCCASTTCPSPRSTTPWPRRWRP